MKTRFFRPFRPLDPHWSPLLTIGSFLLPLLLWAAFSYIPWLWHPYVKITDPGSLTFLQKNMLMKKADFNSANQKAIVEGKTPAKGIPANPIFLPAPHEVAIAFYKAFTTPPRRPGEPWLHESLWHSIQIIFWGFFYSSLIGLPLGILCGVYPPIARLTEPVIDFIRYMPAPAFGALAVAILGIYDAPKIAIIFIGTFFQQVLVIANTTRNVEYNLIEAALTLGTSQRQLLSRVVIPAIAPNLYQDMRILLGWAWTYLIVAEYIGASSGITFFINQQAKYRIYDNVYVAIIMIGIIGFVTDRVLDDLGKALFPWHFRDSRSIIGSFYNWLKPNYVPRNFPIRVPSSK
ncbi:MAG: ABC transporter permease subunit [Chthoniobacterales bacterium]|nr:ABC transporter permease subunit [Chthoniobacterales bacterium]